MSAIECAQQIAQEAAKAMKRLFSSDKTPDVALILGTGWGDALKLRESIEIPLAGLPGFRAEAIQTLQGHSRTVICGNLAGKRVIALRGRLHLNEHPTDPNLPLMVRLQVQMLAEMGVQNFILTNAAGSLVETCRVGDIMVADGFVTLFAPPMPLYAGEFCSPEDKLSSHLSGNALSVINLFKDLNIHEGGYAMVRGPFFEGRCYDKQALRATGAMAVGMSTLPEMCILALYEQTQALCLSFITNTAHETHSHEENQARAKKSSALLGAFLEQMIDLI